MMVISASGCLFLGRPCAPGKWQYHCGPCGCGIRANELECPNDAGQLAASDSCNSQDTRGGYTVESMPETISQGTSKPGRQLQPRPAKIPAVPPVTVSKQVADEDSFKPYSEPGLNQSIAPSEVQKCDWQEPDEAPQSSSPRTGNSGKKQRGDLAGETSSHNAEVKSLLRRAPVANDTAASGRRDVPYAWGYFGALGKW
jgi:hypothetical protein